MDDAGRHPRRLRLSLMRDIALASAGLIACLGTYVLVGWTVALSLTGSRVLPSAEFVGTREYRRLFANVRWWTAVENLALYCLCVIGTCIVAGYLLAILVDRSRGWQGFYRTIFMLPMSMSFVVTGVVWQWLLNPALGIQHAVRELGWVDFRFDWLVRGDRAIYTLIIATIWQHTGLCMAMMLAGMQNVDANVWRLARIDAVPVWRVYAQVITPMLRPIFFTAAVVLFSMSVKSFDLVATLTGGGPGFSSDLPGRFVVDMIGRQDLGMAAAAATILLCTVCGALVPCLYLELRRYRSR
jgi:glucose/mannose transport system permease protein